jgi:hypothetical protein
MLLKKIKNILSGAIFLSLVLLIGCSSSLQSLKNVKQGESIVGSQNGLLVGAILLRQGEKTVTLTGGQGSGEMLQIKNTETDQKYSHKIEGTADVKDIEGFDFRLLLGPGQYSLTSLRATGINVNQTTTAKVSPWLINILTLPLGVVTVPGQAAINLPTPFSSFEIKPHEATYIGTLIIEIPDPLPNGRFNPQYKILNEETPTTADLKNRILGIEKVVTALVVVQQPAQSVAPNPELNPK